MNPQQVIISWEQWEEYQNLKRTPLERESDFAKKTGKKIRHAMEDPNRPRDFTLNEVVEILENWPEGI